MGKNANAKVKKSTLDRVPDTIERVGNKLPDPITMFLGLAVIGSAVAEKSGFLVAVMERFLGGAKGWIVTLVVVFLGINLNIAGDAGNMDHPAGDLVCTESSAWPGWRDLFTVTE